MKIILDTNIIHYEKIPYKISKRVESLLKFCKDNNHTIVIPETTLLEFRQHRTELISKKRNDLDTAYRLLDEYKITHTKVTPSDAITEPDLIDVFSKTGVNVLLEKPSYQDFIEAHRRACLHEAPAKLGTKSDEMRDIVLWTSALRIAKNDGGAVLVSNDDIHHNPLADIEASGVKLVRVKSPEDALEYFDVMTPSGEIIKKFLDILWDDLLKKGLPLTATVSLNGIKNPKFVQSERGLALAQCSSIKLRVMTT